ncbi:DUF6114 domain-containing protein [Streptomyces sp. NPDC051940]|uniref:DUF6114 domain-containing protein n=1 Tax=Streptomyces sp. NPDC051940 TaxID=3155675 RepID=UPI00344AB90C
MSVEPSLQDEHWLRHWRRRFRTWRGTRPFWAGLFTILGGVPIGYLPYHNLQMGTLTVRMATTAGAGALIIGVLLVTLGLTMWYHSIVRVFAGVAAVVLALVSIPVSNFGGLIIGFMLAMVGGALAIAWAPGTTPAGEPAGPEGSHGTDPDEAEYVSGQELLPGAAPYTPEPAASEPQAEEPGPEDAGRSSATISVTKAPSGGSYAQ